ncbi:MAG TPA: Maf family protein [Candidatus Saccharimonadales bacterium]|jgi:septum formation protein|nr:Maf family protein [Candidatus Saccharimonadales bacterium]
MIRLASGSPRRRELVALLGVPFEVAPADVDERAAPRPALAKARAVAPPGEVTLAADTMIELDGERIGKPADAADAVAMLERLAGREHLVRTEVAIVNAAGRALHFGVRSTVTMVPADDRAIRAYVASGEPLDRAGAYAIQGGGAALVAAYAGCFANIVGLPLCHTFFALRKTGVAMPERPEPAFARAFGFTCPAWRLAYAQGRHLRDGAEYDSTG